MIKWTCKIVEHNFHKNEYMIICGFLGDVP